MKLALLKFIIVYFACLSTVYAGNVNVVAKSDIYFPQNVVIKYNNDKLNLIRTGITVRKKFFLKIYSMAHYVEQKPDKSLQKDGIYQSMMQQTRTKQISMIFLRSLKAEKIKESLVSGIKLNTDKAEYSKILPQIEAFMRAINEDVEENDEFVLRWHTDGTIVSLFQGKEISSIQSENFARALWSIWFSDYSVVDRNMLIEELLTSS